VHRESQRAHEALFDGHGVASTRSSLATGRYLLAAVLVYQLLLLYRFEVGRAVRVGLKALFQAA
jgi:hypothetical protein